MLTCCRRRRIPKFSQCENQNTYFSLYSTTAQKEKEEGEDQRKKVTIKMFMVYIEKKGGRNNERIYKEKVH